MQQSFLHEQALITRHEVMGLLCKHFLLPKTPVTYSSMNELGWHFAQKLIRQDGKKFWATDTRFPYGGLRRDNLRIIGSEYTGTGSNKRRNALCCQAVLFLTVTNLTTILRHARTSVATNTMTFVLGRWFQPHRYVRLRDNDNRPICPGHLKTNHCLWKYARTERPRPAMVINDRPSAAFERQKLLFGVNGDQQIRRYERDKHAYYCLLETNTIAGTMNMCPEFIGNTSAVDYSTWLQSVVLI